MLEDYLKIKTGQDLIDLNIIPKTSCDQLTAITYERLKAIRDQILSQITDEVLGAWTPALEASWTTVGTEITDARDIQKYAQPGMRVVATGVTDGNDLTGLEGTIRCIPSNQKLGVEFDTPITRGHTLENRAPCQPGHGFFVEYRAVKLKVPEGKIPDKFQIAKGVVADKNLGHRIKFTEEYNGSTRQSDGYGSGNVRVPAGSIGTLVQYDISRNLVSMRLDNKIDGVDAGRTFTLSVSKDLYDTLRASSLGQMIPLDKEMEVKRETMMRFFPRAVLEWMRAERIIMGMLMPKDYIILYGPPGGGKSQVGKDIIDIARQQELSFTVEGCQVQCNPFSLFDEAFSRQVSPCPECAIKYDPNKETPQSFKQTGMFKRPKPKDVKVTVARYGEGKGIERKEGTISLDRMHLIGYKLPRLDGTTTEGRENDYDPEGFHPGALPRTNNGVLLLEELDKLRPQALDNLLEALNDRRVQPDQLRFSVPSNQVILATANDHTKFSGALVDRMLLLAVRYPTDVDVSYGITRSTYHAEFKRASDVKITNPHGLKNNVLRSIPMATTLERSVDAFYLKFRADYSGPGKNEVSGSNRSKFDALDAARAKLAIDQLFFSSCPDIPDLPHLTFGIQYALCCRVQISNEKQEQDAKDAIRAYVAKELPALVQAEENTWWCRVYKHLAIAQTQIPGIETALVAEMQRYREDPTTATKSFAAVKDALQHPDIDSKQHARIDHPFMDYLFKEQPHFGTTGTKQLVSLTKYYVQSHAEFLQTDQGKQCEL